MTCPINTSRYIWKSQLGERSPVKVRPCDRVRKLTTGFHLPHKAENGSEDPRRRAGLRICAGLDWALTMRAHHLDWVWPEGGGVVVLHDHRLTKLAGGPWWARGWGHRSTRWGHKATWKWSAANCTSFTLRIGLLVFPVFCTSLVRTLPMYIEYLCM
jgi:hypothetical protein